MKRLFFIFLLLATACASKDVAVTSQKLDESHSFSYPDYYDMILKSPQWAGIHTFDEKLKHVSSLLKM